MESGNVCFFWRKSVLYVGLAEGYFCGEDVTKETQRFLFSVRDECTRCSALGSERFRSLGGATRAVQLPEQPPAAVQIIVSLF